MLDEGVAALDEVDRRAILLRFFENHGFRDIGATLGMSEDAAQKRVGRALERLRVFLSGRGVTTGAAGLAATLTARAVEPAPPGLGVAIARSASGLVGKGAVVHASISGTQKLMAVAMCAVAVGVMLRVRDLDRPRTRTLDPVAGGARSPMGGLSCGGGNARRVDATWSGGCAFDRHGRNGPGPFVGAAD